MFGPEDGPEKREGYINNQSDDENYQRWASLSEVPFAGSQSQTDDNSDDEGEDKGMSM